MQDRVAALEVELTNVKTFREKLEDDARASVKWAHSLFVEAYCDLGAEATPLNRFGDELGTRFLGWLQEGLASLPATSTWLMYYASLATCQGAANALSREGCHHFEVFK
jgi:hypothetical protein